MNLTELLTWHSNKNTNTDNLKSSLTGALLGLPLLFLLSACQAAPVKLPDGALSKMQSIRVVAVEMPPLEVLPDLLTSRMPVYRHYDNMVLPIYPELALYRNPGGILIAGQIGQGDSVKQVSLPQNTDKTQRLHSTSAYANVWLPTSDLAIQAVSQLNTSFIKARTVSYCLGLPLQSRHADLLAWRTAVEQWYGQNTTALDYRQLEREPVDAVVEIGIGHYRIFEGQVKLQVLIKVIDPHTRQVIARTGRESVSTDTSTQVLLRNEGAKFKALVLEKGAHLLAQAFHDVGLI